MASQTVAHMADSLWAQPTTKTAISTSNSQMEAFLKDLKHSFRMFAQSPAFTLAAVAALTLGIGANTAIFSVVNAVLLKPVAVPDSERVVVFINVGPRGPGGPAASPAKF